VDVVQDTRLLRLAENDLDQLARRYPRIASVVFRNLNAIVAGRLARATWGSAPALPAPGQAAEGLAPKARALDDVFFRRETDRFRRQLKLVASQPNGSERQPGEALGDATGFPDRDVAMRLAELGIQADTLAALTLIPLVEVAWADGRMEENERRAVLAGAESYGLRSDSPSHGLLRVWLEHRPAPDLLEAWREFIGAVAPQLSVESRLRLKGHILPRARAVAESAGGLLGLATISREEEAMLTTLEAAFGTVATPESLRGDAEASD
jgi:hypothetical protein